MTNLLTNSVGSTTLGKRNKLSRNQVTVIPAAGPAALVVLSMSAGDDTAGSRAGSAVCLGGTLHEAVGVMYGEFLGSSQTEKCLEEHEDAFRWFVLLIRGGLVVRFVLDALGAWPWA